MLTFRNSKITYYGPHACENCGAMVVKAGKEWGGTVFTAPKGPVYPNTEWHPHVCDPAAVRALADSRGIPCVGGMTQNVCQCEDCVSNRMGADLLRRRARSSQVVEAGSGEQAAQLAIGAVAWSKKTPEEALADCVIAAKEALNA